MMDLKQGENYLENFYSSRANNALFFFQNGLEGRYKAHNAFQHFNLKITIKKQLHNLNKTLLFSCSLK